MIGRLPRRRRGQPMPSRVHCMHQSHGDPSPRAARRRPGRTTGVTERRAGEEILGREAAAGGLEGASREHVVGEAGVSVSRGSTQTWSSRASSARRVRFGSGQARACHQRLDLLGWRISSASRVGVRRPPVAGPVARRGLAEAVDRIQGHRLGGEVRRVVSTPGSRRDLLSAADRVEAEHQVLRHVAPARHVGAGAGGRGALLRAGEDVGGGGASFGVRRSATRSGV